MTELGKAYIQLVPKAEGIESDISSVLGDPMGSAGEEAGSLFGENFIDFSKIAMVAGAAVIIGIVKEMAQQIGDLARLGDEIDKTSQKMGISAEAYQKWDFVLQHAGSDIGSMKMGLKTLGNVIYDAGEGSEDASKKLGALGLSYKDLQGMSKEDQMQVVIERLQGIDDQATRTALAQDIFGRSAQELGPLLNMSSEEMEGLMDSADKLGGVMSDETVKASADFQDSMLDMDTAIQGVKTRMFEDFLPSVSEVMEGLALLISGDGGGFDMIIEGISGFVETMLTKGGEFVQKFVDGVVLKLPELVEQGYQMAVDFVNTLGEQLPQFLSVAGEWIGGLVQGFVSNLPNLISNAVTGVINLVGALLENMPAFISAGVDFIMSVGQGLIDGLGDVIAGIPELCQNIWDAFMDIDWVELGKNIVYGIGEGLLSLGEWLWDGACDLGQSLVDGFCDFFGINSPSRLTRDLVGKNVAYGIGEGLQDAKNDVLSDANDVSEGISRTLNQSYNLGETSSYATDGDDVPSLLKQLVQSSEKEYKFVVNGREFALATAQDINDSLGMLQRREARL